MATNPPAPTRAGKPNPEIRTARNWYIWLWVSPFITLTSAILLYNLLAWYWNLFYVVPTILLFSLAVLGSAIWHLVLLVPAIGGETSFIRWHGWQALLLAGLRTITALGFVLLSPNTNTIVEFACIGVLALLIIYFGGNIWGMRNAQRGDCWLMRMTGHGEGLPLATVLSPAPVNPSPAGEMPEKPVDIDGLIEKFRFDPDPEKRRLALAELERLGFVESLS